MEWFEPIFFPSAAVGDPRLKPRHLSLLAALHYFARRYIYFDLQIPNRDLMVLARIGDHETLYRYRLDLDRIGYLSFFQWRGFATEYELKMGDLGVPAGLLADQRLTSPGTIALYVALTALATGTRSPDDMYGTHVQISNPFLQEAARFSGPAQLRRYSTELTDVNVMGVTRNRNKPHTYELTLNQGANQQLLAVAATL